MKIYVILLTFLLVGCRNDEKSRDNLLNAGYSRPLENEKHMSKKQVVYQVFTRLFGNTNTTNKPWGTIEENGIGKFSDFTAKALREIKELGVTYIWVYRSAASCRYS